MGVVWALFGLFSALFGLCFWGIEDVFLKNIYIYNIYIYICLFSGDVFLESVLFAKLFCFFGAFGTCPLLFSRGCLRFLVSQKARLRPYHAPVAPKKT